MDKIDKYLLRLTCVAVVIFMLSWLYAMIAPNIILSQRVYNLEQSLKRSNQQIGQKFQTVQQQLDDKQERRR